MIKTVIHFLLIVATSAAVVEKRSYGSHQGIVEEQQPLLATPQLQPPSNTYPQSMSPRPQWPSHPTVQRPSRPTQTSAIKGSNRPQLAYPHLVFSQMSPYHVSNYQVQQVAPSQPSSAHIVHAVPVSSTSQIRHPVSQTAHGSLTTQHLAHTNSDSQTTNLASSQNVQTSQVSQHAQASLTSQGASYETTVPQTSQNIKTQLTSGNAQTQQASQSYVKTAQTSQNPKVASSSKNEHSAQVSQQATLTSPSASVSQTSHNAQAQSTLDKTQISQASKITQTSPCSQNAHIKAPVSQNSQSSHNVQVASITSQNAAQSAQVAPALQITQTGTGSQSAHVGGTSNVNSISQSATIVQSQTSQVPTVFSSSSSVNENNSQVTQTSSSSAQTSTSTNVEQTTLVVNELNVTNSLPGSEKGLEADIESIINSIFTFFSCHNRRYGYYADPNDCTIFIICNPVRLEDGRIVYLQFNKRCAPGTVFNQRLLTCTHPDEAPPCHSVPDFYEVNREFEKTSSTSCAENEELNNHTSTV